MWFDCDLVLVASGVCVCVKKRNKFVFSASCSDVSLLLAATSITVTLAFYQRKKKFWFVSEREGTQFSGVCRVRAVNE